jgi:hypothetical protein
VSPRIALLLRQLDAAYERSAWHGPNLRGSLRGVTAAEAARRPAPGRHNVWELAVHAAYWKYAARRRLTGEKRGSFELSGSNWFERPAAGGASERAWRADLALLDREHRALRDVVAGLPDSSLDRRVIPGRGTRERMVYGVVAHDVYHAGQIQLVKALIRRRTRRAKTGS